MKFVKDYRLEQFIVDTAWDTPPTPTILTMVTTSFEHTPAHPLSAHFSPRRTKETFRRIASPFLTEGSGEELLTLILCDVSLSVRTLVDKVNLALGV